MNKTISCFLFLFLLSTSLSGQTIPITGNTSAGENQEGWMFNRDITSSTPIEFGFGNASIGVGSLYVKPIQNVVAKDKFIGEYFFLKEISELDSFTYEFRLGAGVPSTSAKHFYLNVYANFAVSGPFKFYDCRYDVIPTTGSNSNYTEVSFEPGNVYPVTQSGSSPVACPTSPSQMGPGATIRVFAINVGDTSLSDQNLAGYIDKVVVSRLDGATTFDLEPTLTPTSAEQCKKGGWMSFNTPIFENQGSCVSFVVSNSPNN